MTRKRKNLDFTENCIRTIRIEAAKNGGTFKSYCEDLIEKHSKKMDRKNKK